MLLSLWNHLSSRRHRQLVLLLALVFLSALADVITLGAVLPFISVLTTPERVYSYPLVSSAADSMEVDALYADIEALYEKAGANG